jgi:hypothetical protein
LERYKIHYSRGQKDETTHTAHWFILKPPPQKHESYTSQRSKGKPILVEFLKTSRLPVLIVERGAQKSNSTYVVVVRERYPVPYELPRGPSSCAVYSKWSRQPEPRLFHEASGSFVRGVAKIVDGGPLSRGWFLLRRRKMIINPSKYLPQIQKKEIEQPPKLIECFCRNEMFTKEIGNSSLLKAIKVYL